MCIYLLYGLGIRHDGSWIRVPLRIRQVQEQIEKKLEERRSSKGLGRWIDLPVGWIRIRSPRGQTQLLDLSSSFSKADVSTGSSICVEDPQENFPSSDVPLLRESTSIPIESCEASIEEKILSSDYDTASGDSSITSEHQSSLVGIDGKNFNESIEFGPYAPAGVQVFMCFFVKWTHLPLQLCLPDYMWFSVFVCRFLGR